METDLILREKLSIERTIMANQTTFLSFLRTALYFLVAGLSIRNLLKMTDDNIIHLSFYIISGIILLIGIFNYFKQNKKIAKTRKHIGNIQIEHLMKEI